MVNDGNFDLVHPLHEACFHGNIECVQELLSAGATVDCRNIDGSTPLCDACSSGNVDCVKLLLKSGANVNPKLLLSSPLHEAVLRDKVECAQLLVDAGANLNQTDCHFGTPLHAAVTKGSLKCLVLLLKAGCNVNCIKILNTPLHLAARQQDIDAVSVLLQFGANTNMTNNYDLTAKDMVPSSTSSIRQILQQWECNPRSMKFLCRQVIRQCLGQNGLRQVHKLNLPNLLTDFLLYEYIH
ncbi:ankyrin repeat and SOCS box protein 13-like isoform X2 [Ruditapes philippinarum]|nr:ankyrin repeat and SOCS box protein 13-like isoform X2 [Ruditapes philippinarum]